MANWASCLLIVGGTADALANLDLQGSLRRQSPNATMDIEPVPTAKAEIAAFTFEAKYAAPVAWIEMISAEHPRLRFVLEWVDDIFDHCGHSWLLRGKAEISIYLSYEYFNFGPRQLLRGWVTDSLVWVLHDVETRPDWELVAQLEKVIDPEMAPPRHLEPAIGTETSTELPW